LRILIISFPHTVFDLERAPSKRHKIKVPIDNKIFLRFADEANLTSPKASLFLVVQKEKSGQKMSPFAG